MRRNLSLPLLVILFVLSAATGRSQTITTFAGNGTPGYTGNGGQATAATLSHPSSVAFDATGNMYIADFDNNVVRKITTSGIITTIAGNGTPGYSGDGFAATASQLNAPSGVATDNLGNVYIVDQNNNVVRVVNALGLITTFAGTGSVGYAGDGSLAIAARLNFPYAVATDNTGNVYIADAGNNAVRRVNLLGIITTIAGNGTGGFAGDTGPATAANLNTPTGLAADTAGNIYIADNSNHRIRMVNATGIISTFAGSDSLGYMGNGGAATDARLYFPFGVATDRNGNVYIADQANNVVRRVSSTGIITGYAGNDTFGYSGDGGNALLARLARPRAVAVDNSGALYIADYENYVIRAVSPNSAPSFVNGSEMMDTTCQNTNLSLNNALRFEDTDFDQTETLSLQNAPAHGTVTGLPASYAANGDTITPVGIVYHPTSGFSGMDTMSFVISDGGLSDTITMMILVNPRPSVNDPSNQVLCSGENTTPVIFTGSGTTYTWSNNNTSIGLASSGTGNIASFTVTDTSTSTVTSTIIVTPIAQGCTGTTQSFSIGAKPLPTVAPTANMNVCNGSTAGPVNFSGTISGTTYTWTNDNTSIGLANSGTGNIAAFTATSGGGFDTATVIVVPGLNGCDGTADTFDIMVQPSPTVNAVAGQTLCNGSNTSAINFSGTATSYTWTNNRTSIGLASSGTGNIASFTAANATNTNQVATITVTPNGPGCPGTTRNFTITVKPTPTVDATTDMVLCNGAPTGNINFTGNVSGTLYIWTNTDTSIGLAASDTGNIASFTATNNTLTSDTAWIVVSPMANGCGGATDTFSIIVNPGPGVNQPGNQSICNEATTTAINFTGSAVSYTWTNNNPSIGLASSGTGNIAPFTGTNAGSSAATATVTVTPNGPGCPGTARTFTISVKPTPAVNPISDVTFCNAAMTGTVSFAGSISGTTYTWTNNNTRIGLATSGTGNITPFMASDTMNVADTARIIVTPRLAGCTGFADSFRIIISPTISVSMPANQSICTGAATAAANFSSFYPGATYNWTNNNTSIGLAASGTGNIASFTGTNSTGTPVTATIRVSPMAGSCAGNMDSFTITVNPVPNVAPVTDRSVCNRDTVNTIVFTGSFTGTNYNWLNSDTTIGLAASGTGNIGSFAGTNPGSTVVISRVIVTPALGGCQGTSDTFNIRVNPTPTLTSSLAPADLCDSTNFIYGPTSATTGTLFTWSRAAVSGISNPAASGSDTIRETLVNTTNMPVTIIYRDTLRANGCSNVQSIILTINPRPELSTTLTPAAICDGTEFVYAPASTTPGATFTWSRPTIAGIVNPAASGMDTIRETLTSGSSAPVTVTYYDTVHANGCMNTQEITFILYPTPELNSPLNPAGICNGVMFNYTHSSPTTGTTFSWYRPAVSEISNAAASDTGNISEMLTNNATYPVNVIYFDTLRANGCSNVQQVIATIYPTPKLSSSLHDSVCSGMYFSYVPASLTPGATYAWYRPAVTGILPITNNGTGNIGEVLTNTTGAPIDAIYSYTITANSCNNTQLIRKTVLPPVTAPIITTNGPANVCSNTMYQNFGTATPPAAGTTYNWAASNATIFATGSSNQYCVVNFTQPGTAYIYLQSSTVSIGCANADTFRVDVSSSVADHIDVIYYNNRFICSPGNEDSYQWGYDDAETMDSVMIPGAVNQDYYNSAPGFGLRYWWVMNGHNGCMQKTYYNTPMSVVQTTTAVAGIEVYPNPAEGSVTVSLSNVTGRHLSLKIINAVGQTVKQIDMPGAATQIDVSDLTSGIYIIYCDEDGQRIGTSRFIKN